MSALFIYCAGGFGKEVMDVAIRFNAANQRWTSIFFLDDFCETSIRYDTKVFKFDKACEWLQKNEGMVIIATGEPSARAMLRSKLEGKGVTLDTLIDTTTVVADSARIESGVVITAFCSVSSDAVIQLNASVNTMSIVGHDVLVGENTVISSMVNIGGETKIGRNSYIGMGALIKEGVTIGNDVIIGMGSVVYNNIPDNMIALGNPARPMRSNDNKKVFR